MNKLAAVVRTLANAVGIPGHKLRSRLQPKFLLGLLLILGAGPVYGQTYLDVHDFGAGLDGAKPLFGVTIDRFGNMYGTALGEGANNTDAGMIWEITASGKYLDLHDFGKPGDGNDPKGGVTIDSSGNLYGTTVGGGATGGGMIWEITTSGIYYDLHDFGSLADGLGPAGALTIDGSGNLYGTTSFEGANFNGGNVWEITASGKYLDLHDFGSGNDGIGPQAGVTYDASGDLFGTAYLGGANNLGMVWEITASGKYIDLHDFGAGNDGAKPVAGVTLDGSGNLYGTAPVSAGSDIGPGVLWEITASGNYQILHAFGSNGDGSQANAGVTIDGSGNLYGTATDGGAHGYGVVWTITGGVYKILHSFGSSNDGTNPWAAVTVDAMGNLYGTTYFGGANGTDSGVVWEIASATLSRLTVSPTSVLGGASASGAVMLSGEAPAGGLTVGLSSSSVSAEVPSSVTVASGATSATFAITTFPVSSTVTATITGTAGTTTKTATVTVTAKTSITLTLNPSSVLGGSSSTGTVQLNNVAGAGGVFVSLLSGNSSATVPGSVTIPSGSRSATFVVSTTGVNVQTSAVITASTNGTSQSATLTILPASLAGVNLIPSSVKGGASSTGMVTLNGPAGPGGTAVALSSSNSAATLPSSVTVPAGQKTATFTVGTVTVSASTSSTITAGLNGASQQAILTINSVTLVSVSVNPSIVAGSASSMGTVTVTSPAGSVGMVVELTSSNAAASAPNSVTITAGRSSATFVVKTVTVTTQTPVTLTASLGTQSGTTVLTVAPVGLTSLTFNPVSIVGGSTAVGAVGLNGPAPRGGVVVKLASQLAGVMVPGSVTVAAGKPSATFAVRTVAVGSQVSATISASANGTVVSAVLTIKAPSLKSLTLSPSSVSGGKSSTGTVTISSAAPAGGLVVSLASSLASVSAPAMVTVPAGRTSATFTVKTSAVSSKSSATISASLGGLSKTAVLTIK